MERCTTWCYYSKECKKNQGRGYKETEYCYSVKREVHKKNQNKLKGENND